MPFTPAFHVVLKLRSRSHNLEEEVRRHKGLHRECRICIHYNSREVEDKEHFLFKCTRYFVVRGQYHFSIEEAAGDVTKFVNYPAIDAIGHYFLDCNRLRV